MSCLDPTFIHWNPAIWSCQGTLWPEMPDLWHFGSFLASLGAPSDYFGGSKWHQLAAPDVSYLDPTLIHAVPPIWSLQGSLWPYIPHLWHFGAILDRSGGPLWHFPKGLKVPTYRPGCLLTRSNLDPRSTTNLEPPGQLMSSYTPFMAFWGCFRP